jgi:hypothetical protein
MARLSITDLEIERKDDPFEIEMSDGTVFTFKDPKAIPFAGLLLFDPKNLMLSMRVILGDDDFDNFAKNPEVDGYFLTAIFEKYMKHYDLLPPGEDNA